MLDGNKIAIYQQEYLTISMTFIYRQLQGIQKIQSNCFGK